jgi:hypothetical protein
MDEIKKCLISANSHHLVKAIEEHNNCSEEVSKLNELMSCGILCRNSNLQLSNVFIIEHRQHLF